ncbi:MAG TPA: hypothetical protein VKF63_02995 [Terracidiphilus sp.]|nr:hypothetical protein [Terracidiphilus sp.]
MQSAGCEEISIGVIMGDTKFEFSRFSNAPVSSAELLADIQRASRAVGPSILSQKLYSEFGRYDTRTVTRRFGSWNKALVAAGLETTFETNYSDVRLFENVMLLWEHYGRQPRQTEVECPPSLISMGPYKRRFSTWKEALEQFVVYANSQDKTPPSPIEVASGHRTSRFPSLRLQYQIKQRDHFSCRACGASPALTLGVQL